MDILVGVIVYCNEEPLGEISRCHYCLLPWSIIDLQIFIQCLQMLGTILDASDAEASTLMELRVEKTEQQINTSIISAVLVFLWLLLKITTT